jgi:hypothetical protein
MAGAKMELSDIPIEGACFGVFFFVIVSVFNAFSSDECPLCRISRL